MKCLTAIAPLLLCAWITGCDRPRPSLPTLDFYKIELWLDKEDLSSGVPGIDKGAIYAFADNKPRSLPIAAIWVDGPLGSWGGEEENTHGRRTGSYWLKPHDGKSARFTFYFRMEKSDEVEFSVDDVPYDLNRGRLFLVSTQGDEAKIKQLDRDFGLTGMRFDEASIRATVKEDAEIREFFEQANSQRDKAKP